MQIWIILGIAIAFEVAGTLLLKASNGFENLLLGMVSIGCYMVSFWLFAPVLKVLPAGVAYAIWAGVGISMVAILGFVLFKESLSAAQIAFIGLILTGAVGLNLTTSH